MRGLACLLTLALAACGIKGAPEPVPEAPAAEVPAGPEITERIPPG